MTKESMMHLKRGVFLGAALTATLALGACDSSKADLDRTRGELAASNTERDGLRSELDAEKTKVTNLDRQVTALNAKLTAAQSAGANKPATASQGSTPAAFKKEEKPAKHAAKSIGKGAHAPSQKG
jgi:uncharacterized protein YlxW (UPF0749 family)